MKAHLAKLSLALLSAVFLFGCQDMGSGPVGPEGPQFGAKSCSQNPNQGKCKSSAESVSLFQSDGTIGALGAGESCAGGANKDATAVGHVTWGNIRRTDNHTHADVVVSASGVAMSGTYAIFGNQDVLCSVGRIDFGLRPGHKRVVKVDGSGVGAAKIGLTFGTEDEPPIAAGHAPGSHFLWLTIAGPLDDNGELPDSPDLIIRSVAFEMVIKQHDGEAPRN